MVGRTRALARGAIAERQRIRRFVRAVHRADVYDAEQHFVHGRVRIRRRGLDRDAWNALRHGPPAAYGLYGDFVANLQDPPTRDNLFLYALWQDALVGEHLDLTVIVRHDLVDQSRLQWLEMRYHWTRVDVALQTQLNTGQPGSNYGALPDRRLWQALAR